MEDECDAAVTVIVCVDAASGCMSSTFVPKKGTNQYAVVVGTKFIEDMGYKKVILKTDGERSILAWSHKVKAETTAVDIRLKMSPRYFKGSVSTVETYHGTFQSQLRTLKLDVEKHFNIKVGLKHVLVPWVNRHIGWTVTRFHVKSNKQTIYDCFWANYYSHSNEPCSNNLGSSVLISSMPFSLSLSSPIRAASE